MRVYLNKMQNGQFPSLNVYLDAHFTDGCEHTNFWPLVIGSIRTHVNAGVNRAVISVFTDNILQICSVRSLQALPLCASASNSKHSTQYVNYYSKL